MSHVNLCRLREGMVIVRFEFDNVCLSLLDGFCIFRVSNAGLSAETTAIHHLADRSSKQITLRD